VTFGASAFIGSSAGSLNLSDTASVVPGGGGGFFPAANNTQALGSTSFRWTNITAGFADLSSTIKWGAYTYAVPTGSTTTFLRNDGTWAYREYKVSDSFKLAWKDDEVNANKPEKGSLILLRQRGYVTHLVKVLDCKAEREIGKDNYDIYRIVEVLWAIDFDNPPVYIPKHYINGTYEVYGCFCSPECAAAHLMKEPIDSSTKFERYYLLNSIYGKNKNIKIISDAISDIDGTIDFYHDEDYTLVSSMDPIGHGGNGNRIKTTVPSITKKIAMLITEDELWNEFY
jgi:hypothetical protein